MVNQATTYHPAKNQSLHGQSRENCPWVFQKKLAVGSTGRSTGAVALPVGVDYAQLAGFNPIVGLYVSSLLLVVYALFGTTRQLIVGPDAATYAMVAALPALVLSVKKKFIEGVLLVVQGVAHGTSGRC